jgi:CDP-glucose 4,6-dehydratase
MIAQRQFSDNSLADCYNVGPDDCDCISTGALTNQFCEAWGEGLTWESGIIEGPHEAGFLKLDCSKIKSLFGWKPRWNINEAVLKTVEWTKEYLTGGKVCNIMDDQIEEYMKNGGGDDV